MSEKVLGFKEKEAKRLLKKVSKEFGKGYPYIIEHDFELLEIIEYMLKQQASESVDLKWLEGECKRISPERDLNKFFTNRDVYHVEYGKVEAIRELLCAVRAKAKEVKK